MPENIYKCPACENIQLTNNGFGCYVCGCQFLEPFNEDYEEEFED